ncbi:MAG: carboxypeptidase-like regulatory domain-containing protein [Gemmataceae bacterium]|nr:carboxypeptidase-like regulatory domain-containing protein [Gemmataceae bacterium]
MRRLTAPVLVLVGLAAGCGGPRMMEEPVEVSGTVARADGQPVSGVQLVLRPKGEGHPAGGPVAADGSFTVKAVPGEFMFYFQPIEDPKADRSAAQSKFRALPKEYQDVSVDHTASLSAGGGNRIQLK